MVLCAFTPDPTLLHNCMHCTLMMLGPKTISQIGDVPQMTPTNVVI